VFYPEVQRTLPRYADKTPHVIFRNLGDSTFEELIDVAGQELRPRTPVAAARLEILTTMATSTFSSSI
jgi:hypothetical protein